MKKLSSFDIREKFLRFFEKYGHIRVSSSPLVSRLDPTLLFANAGMNQFKGVFMGQEKREYSRAVSAQKCVRAGGKHNDLENVGRTGRHNTFFEMLGNFSFGDYFKKEAIHYAWEFVTQELSLPKDRLYASIFDQDEDAFHLWRDEIGLDPKRIYRFGAKDNFWAMGDTGPCGPCSEIFFDQGEKVGCGRSDCDVGCNCDRYVEFWNLVFMEFEQKSDGTRTNLPKPSIDTGMGLERITAIIQGVTSNYDTDLFTPLLKEISGLSKHDYWNVNDEEIKVSMRVISDHIRATTFLISDGVRPSNEGRGYVLRRIMRRAMRHGRKLGLENFFLHRLSSVVAKEMGNHYGELKKNFSTISLIIKEEEERFIETIDRGLELLDQEILKIKEKKQNIFSGKVAFHLYDTYGFPIDLTTDILRDHGLALDHQGFDSAFVDHREKARGSWKGSQLKAMDDLTSKWVSLGIRSEFQGYENLICDGKIIRIVKSGKEIEVARSGDEIELISNSTPFYGESGGQVGDIGWISGEKFSLEVVDTKKLAPEIIFHYCKVNQGEVKTGDFATFSVDERARIDTAKNHTATHLLHATLREVLGEHVVQKGSLVAPERLRFDFSHPSQLTSEELFTIEKKMNERIWLDSPIKKEIMPFQKAISSGAIALFDEKYGTNVRVISVSDYSKELCGGTHLNRTGEIGIFKVVKEGSVAQGVRRIEAFTGYRALVYIGELEQKMREAGILLGSTVEEVTGRIEKLIQQQKELKRRGFPKSIKEPSLPEQILEVKGIKFVMQQVNNLDHQELRQLADQQLERIQSGIVAIGAKQEDKAFIVVKVSKDLATQYNASLLIQPAAKLLGGSGGGRAEMAQAGGPEQEKLGDALRAISSAL